MTMKQIFHREKTCLRFCLKMPGIIYISRHFLLGFYLFSSFFGRKWEMSCIIGLDIPFVFVPRETRKSGEKKRKQQPNANAWQFSPFYFFGWKLEFCYRFTKDNVQHWALRNYSNITSVSRAKGSDLCFHCMGGRNWLWLQAYIYLFWPTKLMWNGFHFSYSLLCCCIVACCLYIE